MLARELEKLKWYLLLGVDQVDFVADHDDWHRALCAQNLGPQRLHLEEGVGVVNVVHEDESVRGLDGEVSHCGELVRARGVQDVEGQLYTGHVEVSVMHLFHRSFVLRRERIVEKLVDYGRFSDLRGPHHHDLVSYRALRRFSASAVRLGQPLASGTNKSTSRKGRKFLPEMKWN